MTLPNAITSLRLVLVPVFAAFYLTGRPAAALVTFIVAALSDSLDGLLARLLNQFTELGAILDPVADKLLGLTALLLLVSSGDVPAWLLLLSLLRDGVVIGVGLTAKLSHKPIPAHPTRISKYATFFLMALVVLALVARTDPGKPLTRFLPAVGLLAAECLVVATGQYSLRWRRLVRERAGAASGVR